MYTNDLNKPQREFQLQRFSRCLKLQGAGTELIYCPMTIWARHNKNWSHLIDLLSLKYMDLQLEEMQYPEGSSEGKPNVVLPDGHFMRLSATAKNLVLSRPLESVPFKVATILFFSQYVPFRFQVIRLDKLHSRVRILSMKFYRFVWMLQS